MSFRHKTRVLLVERDRSALRSYGTCLSKAGFEVTKTLSASDALRQAETQRFDVLVADFQLPGMNGLEVIRRVRQNLDALPCVLLLTAADNQLSLEASESGVCQYLVKPIEPQILEKAVGLAAGVRRQERNVTASPDRRSGTKKRVSFPATEAKNEFGSLLEKAIQGEVVLITKHQAPKAVLISVEAFEALSKAPEARVDRLTAEFDALLARMQGPRARSAMEAAFHASPAELGRAAVKAARKRG